MRIRYAVFALLLGAGPAAAQVTVAEPWVRASVPQQKVSGAFMRLSSVQDARLVEVRSPVADTVELHESTMQDNVMRMRKVAHVPIPAGRGAELKPGGYHVMLSGLRRQLKAGDEVPLTLVIESGGRRETLDVRAPVRALGGGGHRHGKP